MSGSLSRVLLTAAGLLLPLVSTSAQHGGFEPEIRAASEAPEIARRAMEPAPGLQVDLVAAEPLLANPIAMDVAPDGRIYVAETFRLSEGVFDMRSYLDWLDADLGARSVADRITLMREKLGEKVADYEGAAEERVRVLHDDDGDGVYESRVFAGGFDGLAHGLAAGVMFDRVQKNVWLTCIPELWRLRDDDGDLKADRRDAVHTGFGVRFNLIGHDLHGLRIGPDRRLYFSIGDRGLHVERPGQDPLHYPETGAVLRCELDGSHLEAFAFGLRNPQELAFDACGNLFTGDNNSDAGDRARWVYVVEGGDTGWRVGYQWLDDRGPWNRDALWKPHFDGQPAWVVPPVANAMNGPSGLTFNSGTGLPARFDNHFFVCDYRASPTTSGIYASRFATKGAGFELASESKLVWRVCATDVEMAYDGGVLLSDWVAGWGQSMRGRILRVHDPETSKSAAVQETARILREGMAGRSATELTQLLGHADQRVRQDAQFALVDAGASQELAQAATDETRSLYARLHAIWGLGILGRTGGESGLQNLLPLLQDGDSEVVSQTAKVLGEAADKLTKDARTTVRRRLLALLDHPNSRPRFFAVQALGALGNKAACPAILELLRNNADRDPWLRHAAVYALERIGDQDSLRYAHSDESAAVRRGALLALARLRGDGLHHFLRDRDPTIEGEAARAIYRGLHQLPLAAAQALAEQVLRAEFQGAEFGKRAVFACRWLGDSASARRLAHFAGRADTTEELRVMALEILGEWHKPSTRDRLIGGVRAVREGRDFRAGDAALAETLADLLDDKSAPGKVTAAAAKVAGSRKIRSAVAAMTRLAKDRSRPGAGRAAALAALQELDAAGLDSLLDRVTAEDPIAVRLQSVQLLGQRDPARTVPLLASLAENGSRQERQNALRTLGTVQAEAADAVVIAWLDRVITGSAPGDVHLEIVEAAKARARVEGRSAASAALHRYEQWIASQPDDPLAPFHTALEGGTPKLGRKVFFSHKSAQCVRCHAVEALESAAGPRLDDIGKRMRQGGILESLIVPNAKIAQGFDLQAITLNDGTGLMGTVQRETETEVLLVDAAGTQTLLDPATITTRTSHSVSTMPPMGSVLSPTELRDLVAWLAQYGRD